MMVMGVAVAWVVYFAMDFNVKKQEAEAQVEAVIAREVQENENRVLIERLLKKSEFKYTIVDDGDFKLAFEQNSRTCTQVVWITTRIREKDDGRTFKLYSRAYRGTLTEPMTLELPADVHKVGCWSFALNGGNVQFEAQLPTSISPENLKICCKIVAEVAGQLVYKR